MIQYSREELKELLEGVSPTPWMTMEATVKKMKSYVHNSFGLLAGSVEKKDARLMASAPDLARQLLATMDEKLCSMCSNKLSEGAAKFTADYGEAMKHLSR